jgi:phosphoribosylformylglycinamidine synthase
VKIGVLVFPGSNCDHDCRHVFEEVLAQNVTMIWHKETTVSGMDAIIIPGGFSYGDYLRTGAIARFSPVMSAVKDFAQNGGLVLGICNGFQILLEAGLLPGAMLRNRSLHFVCKDVHVRVENAATPFTGGCQPGQVLRIPIAHAEGNYYTDPVSPACRRMPKWSFGTALQTERWRPKPIQMARSTISPVSATPKAMCWV